MTKLALLRVMVAIALVGLGWVGGRAQATQADFELEVSSPNGRTTITCRRGCGLQFIRNAPNKAEAQPSFTYECTNSPKCGGTVQGWVIR